MKVLSGKTIFLLSPQPWGLMHVSKHHYAIELVKHGNTVYFINPPDDTTNGVKIDAIQAYPGLKTVSYKPFFPWKLRFHVRWLFDLLMQQQVKLIRKTIGAKPDLVWCFDPNTFTNLKWFKGRINIYHPVDPITRKDQVNVAHSADILFSVSQKILSAFNLIPIPKYFINHGLGKDFEEQAKLNLAKTDFPKPNGKLKVGYVGNLLRKPIDRPLFLKIMESNKNLEFHLWGPYELQKSNLSGNNDLETLEFIEKLKSFPHVILKGVRSPAQLAIEIQEMDLFFLTYQLIPIESDRSNAHKLIEYISTGKPVLSIDIETYRSLGLIEMTPENDDMKMLELFDSITLNNEFTTESEIRRKRILYALDNTMEKQVKRIDEYLVSIK